MALVVIVDPCGSHHWPAGQQGGALEFWDIPGDFLEEFPPQDEVKVGKLRSLLQAEERLIATIYPDLMTSE